MGLKSLLTSPDKLHALTACFLAALLLAPTAQARMLRLGGAGACAAVDICWLRSEDGRPDQLVAVKRLKPNVAVNLNDLANEGKILRTLRHRCARCARHARAVPGLHVAAGLHAFPQRPHGRARRSACDAGAVQADERAARGRRRNITSLIGVGASLSPRDSAQDESGNPGPQESYYIVQARPRPRPPAPARACRLPPAPGRPAPPANAWRPHC